MHDKINVSCPQSRPVLVVLWQTMGRAINQYKHDCCHGNWLQQVAGIWVVYSCQEPIDTRLRRQLIVWSVCLVTYGIAQRNKSRKSPEKTHMDYSSKFWGGAFPMKQSSQQVCKIVYNHSCLIIKVSMKWKLRLSFLPCSNVSKWNRFSNEKT